MGVGQGQTAEQPLVICRQTQPPPLGTPTQSQPVTQSGGMPVVVVVAQSQLVVEVLLVVPQSGGSLTCGLQFV